MITRTTDEQVQDNKNFQINFVDAYMWILLILIKLSEYYLLPYTKI